MEIWKDIDGYDGDYQISNFGNVKSLKCNKEKIMKLSIKKTGYVFPNLYKNGTKYCPSIHTLVWDHFGDKPRNGRILQIDHIDNNKLNNRIDNLQLLSHRDNNCKKKIKKTSKYIGVYKRGKKWVSQIQEKCIHTHIGTFDSELEAYKAYKTELEKIN